MFVEDNLPFDAVLLAFCCDLAAAKPRDEGADGPIVVVRLDCDPHGLPSEKEANDKTLNSLLWCWKNHFIPKREFDPLFAPSLGKNAGAAGTPGGSPSKPPSSRKQGRDQSPREKGGRDKQDPRDHHAGGYGGLGLFRRSSLGEAGVGGPAAPSGR